MIKRLAICLVFLSGPTWAQTMLSSFPNPATVTDPSAESSLTTIAGAQSANFGGYDGQATASATPANSSHAAGVSVGGLYTVALARTLGGAGILTNFSVKSVGGYTGSYVARIWSKNPTNSTCTDNTNFSGSDTDDPYLITPAFTVTPVAPANTQGDSATYGVGPVSAVSYANQDTTGTKNLYVCLVATATDTADQNKVVRVYMSGPQD